MIGFEYFFYFPTAESRAKQKLAEIVARCGPHFMQCYYCKQFTNDGKMHSHKQKCPKYQAFKEAQQNG